MAGKSTVIRQAAIISLMAQAGSFVPAASARLGLTDRIFSRVGASDNLAQGQSTFMVEMMETARILRQAGKRSLVILDEIGRGTSTFDGLALAWAVVEDLARRGDGGVRTLFATHYHELTVLENELPGVANFNIAVREFKGDIVFLRRMVPGPSDRSYGIEVAKLAGVPRPVVSRAKEILADLERRAGGTRSLTALRAPAEQSVLPGMAPPAPEPAPAPALPKEVEAFIHELKALEVDRLTPIEALNFLHTWKSLNTGEE
jgi:DNA mismatch repair protein MutS